MTEDTVLILRIDRRTKEALATMAERNERSMAATVRYLVKKAAAAELGDPQPADPRQAAPASE